MIDLVELTPQYFSKRSRDYQLLTRVHNAAYNNSKLSIDTMEHLRTANLDDRLADIAAMTVGFEGRHQFTADALKAVYLNFRDICKHKGTKYAIEEIIKVLLRSQNLETNFYVTVTRKNADVTKEYSVNIYINYPSETSLNAALIEDLLDYVLPVGFVYYIYKMGVNTTSVEDVIVSNTETATFIYKTDIETSTMPTYIEASSEGYVDEINSQIIPNREMIMKGK